MKTYWSLPKTRACFRISAAAPESVIRANTTFQKVKSITISNRWIHPSRPGASLLRASTIRPGDRRLNGKGTLEHRRSLHDPGGVSLHITNGASIEADMVVHGAGRVSNLERLALIKPLLKALEKPVASRAVTLPFVGITVARHQHLAFRSQAFSFGI